MPDQQSILWVTNMAPPYRIPVWEHIAKSRKLTIGLLENSRRLAADEQLNRGKDWRDVTVPGATVHEYRTVRLRRGAERHFALYDPAAALDAQRADVLLLSGWDSPAYWQLLAQARATGKATVGFYESILASQAKTTGPLPRARAAFFRQLDAVVVPGPAAREAVEAMGVPNERIWTGFNAVDTSAFAAAPDAEPHAGHRFCYVGQLIDRKNVDGIIQAFAAVAEADDRLSIVGKGELRDALADQASRLGLADRIDFVDQMPNAELPAHLAQQDTLVLASNIEVWGLVVNEALAAGLQAIVSANCGVAPSVAGMEGVFIAPTPSATDIEAAMREAKAGHHGRIAQPEILQYTPERFAQTVMDAFDHALAQHGKADR